MHFSYAVVLIEQPFDLLCPLTKRRGCVWFLARTPVFSFIKKKHSTLNSITSKWMRFPLKHLQQLIAYYQKTAQISSDCWLQRVAVRGGTTVSCEGKNRNTRRGSAATAGGGGGWRGGGGTEELRPSAYWWICGCNDCTVTTSTSPGTRLHSIIPELSSVLMHPITLSLSLPRRPVSQLRQRTDWTQEGFVNMGVARYLNNAFLVRWRCTSVRVFTNATYLNRCPQHHTVAVRKRHWRRYFYVHIYVKCNPQLTAFCHQSQSGSA